MTTITTVALGDIVVEDVTCADVSLAHDAYLENQSAENVAALSKAVAQNLLKFAVYPESFGHEPGEFRRLQDTVSVTVLGVRAGMETIQVKSEMVDSSGGVTEMPFILHAMDGYRVVPTHDLNSERYSSSLGSQAL